MVSLSRLLAAAVDTPPEQQAEAFDSALSFRDCVLPPVLPPGSVPSRLLAAIQLETPSDSTLRDTSAPASDAGAVPASSRPSRPGISQLPLQRLLRDLGPEATAPSNMATLARTLSHFGRPSEAAVASALLFLSSADPPESSNVDSHTMFHLFALFCSDPENPQVDPAVQRAVGMASSSPSEWRTDVLVQAVTSVASQFNAPLDWRLVVRSLDVAGLEKQLTHSAFSEIAKAYIAGTGGTLLPADCILDTWNNPAAQLSMISHSLSAPEYINWDAVELFDGATKDDTSSPYARVALVEKLIELDARDLLQYALREKSDLVLLSLTCAKPRTNTALQQKLTVTLLTPLIASFPKNKKALKQMWNVTPALVEAGIISMWKKDPGMLRVAYIIGVDFQILSDLLSSGTSIEFSLELALLAYREEMLPLEKWLVEVACTRGRKVVSDITLYLVKKARASDANSALHLSLDGVRIVFRCLLSAIGSTGNPQASEIMDGIQEVHQAYIRLNPRMRDLAPNQDVGNPKVLIGSETPDGAVLANAKQQELGQGSNDSGESISEAAVTAAAMLLPRALPSSRAPASFPNAIEKEAGVFFENLYTRDMSTERAVEVLKGLKDSTAEYEQRVFQCAMHSLFDEYRFFKKYPDRELEITGRLFGSIIQEYLLTPELQGLAIKCVLDALRTVEPQPNPPGRLATFGLYSLERFVSRLQDWPQYCSEVLKIPRFAELRPALLNEVKRAMERYRGPIPSIAEKDIGLLGFDGERSNEASLKADGAAPPVTVRDPSADADAVNQLVSSPPPSVNTTPMKDPGVSTTALRASPSMNMDAALVVSPLNLTSLLGMTAEEAKHVVAPDDSVQDKIKFIFNNLSNATMDDKVLEMLEILDAQYHKFFSVYIVVKRASSESNFHHLYLTLLERMSSKAPSLFPMVFDTSYRRVKVLLGSDKITSSTAERMVLKSLGSWIGSLTLARNQPILRRDLDLKELLMDAYSRGRLIAVVPFVSKVLEASKLSRIFKTTNPWIRGILSLMKEIYCVADLKLNMKFELQLLCKGLNIDVNEVTPSDLLRDRPAPDKNNNPDFNTKKPASASPIRSSPSPATSPSPEMRRAYTQAGAGGRAGIPVFSLAEPQASSSTLPPIPVSVGPGSSAARMDVPGSLISTGLGMPGESVGDLTNMLANASLTSGAIGTSQMPRNALHAGGGITGNALPTSSPIQRQNSAIPSEGTVIPNLAQYITISPTLVLFQTNPSLKRLLPLAIDRAIREIIQPVVERSCAIAFLTTKELTLKDFANEPDTGKVRRAALQMVQQLAGSLALVTSKEPLRVSMGNQLRTLLSPVAGDQGLVEQTSQVICAANLEIGCAIIERHAKEKAARDLNEKIAPAFNARRPQHSSYSLGIPPGPEVLRVYDEFSRISRHGAGPPTHAGVQQPSVLTSQTTRQAPAATPVVQATGIAPSQIHNTSGAQLVQDHRTNGTVPETPATERAGSAQTMGRSAAQHENESIAQGTNGGRRATVVPPSIAESRNVPAVYGTALPIMANSADVQAALLAAAGGANGTGLNAQGGQGAGNASVAPGEEALSTQQVLERFNAIYPQLLALIAELTSSPSAMQVTLQDLSPDHEIHGLWIQVPAAVKKSVTADEAGMAVAQKIFKGLYEGQSSLYHEVHVSILEGLRESCRRLSKELVSWLAYSEERKKLHRECIVALLKPGSLLNITNYDELLAKTIDNGRNVNALDFACFLVQRAVIDDPLATAAELALTLEAMAKVGRRVNPPVLPSAPNGLLSLVDASRKVVHQPTATVAAPAVGEGHHGTMSRPARDLEPADPTGSRELVANCLTEWQRILASDSPHRHVPEHVVASFVAQVRTSFLQSDDSRERFFRISVDLLTTVTSAALQGPRTGTPGELSSAPYTAIDSTVRLIGAVCRQDPNNATDTTARGVHLLCQFFIALVRDILKSVGGADLRPQFRMFSGIIQELAYGLSTTDTAAAGSGGNPSGQTNPGNEWVLPEFRTKADALHFLEDKNSGFMAIMRNAAPFATNENGCNLKNMQVLAIVVGALGACSPLVVPGFAFSWLQLMSNKEMLPQLLMSSVVQGGYMFLHLLVLNLSFLATYLRSPQESFTDGVRVLYKGTLRVLLVLLHDFPEFLCDYHMAIVDVIPHNCVQLRNIVLASFPKSMRLPDPFLPELKVDQLPEMASQPRILTRYMKYLEASGLKTVVDTFLQNDGYRRGSPPPELRKYLRVEDNSNGGSYSIPTIGALVLYVGQFAIARSQPGAPPAMEGPVTELIQALTRELDPEGQYHLFNAIANQLRYPNCHTLYYSRLVLCLFHDSSEEYVKEQITRVLLERLIANRPHPWGLLVTFVELVKNSLYNFWGHDFVRCAPEIEELFENVAKVCIGPAMENQRTSLTAAS